MDATAAKRKRPAAAVDDEVSDAEVEEFYAILRRMRDASRRLCGRPPARTPAWRPSFSWEDFAPAAPPQAQAQARPDEEERGPRDDADAAAAPPRAGIDLNVEPEPDTPSSASTPAPATAPATPRSARAQA